MLINRTFPAPFPHPGPKRSNEPSDKLELDAPGRSEGYRVQIDDLPEATIGVSSEAELIEALRAGLLHESFSHVGEDVHVTITRPDGSSSTSTVGALRGRSTEHIAS